MGSAAGRPAGMLKTLVKLMEFNRLPTRPTRERPVAGKGFPKVGQKQWKFMHF
jgi:hypothetical protein